MKITFDIHKSSLSVFIATMLIVLSALLISVWWYSSSDTKNQYLNITVNGVFLKRGYYDILSFSDYKSINNIQKVHFTRCNNTQNIRAVIPVEKNNESFILQFSHIPSDSFIVNSVRITTAYSDNILELKKNYKTNNNGNIIIAPSGINTETINQKVRDSLIILSPGYSLIEKDNKRTDFLIAFITFSLILIFSILYYRKLHIQSCFNIILSVLVLLIISYFFRDIGFRSLLYKKISSSPIVELGIVVPFDDKITLYWAYENKQVMEISDDNKVQYEINGSNEIQNLSFNLPDDKRVEKLRLYLGRLPFGNREIHYLRFRKYDKVVDIPTSSIPSLFTLLYHVSSYKLNKNIINIPINDQNSFIETQNKLTDLLEPIYTYKINRYSGYYLSLIISVLFFFWLYFSSFTDKLSGREKEINI